jgi:hypothetical protein
LVALDAIRRFLILLLKNVSSVNTETALAPLFSYNGTTSSTKRLEISPLEGDAGLYSQIMETSFLSTMVFLKSALFSPNIFF